MRRQSRLPRCASRFALLAVTVLPSALSAATLPQGKKDLSNTPYKDARWGFEFTAFDKWSLIPPDPTERYKLLSFKSPMPAMDPKSGDGYTPTIEVLRFDPEGRSAATLDQGKESGKGGDGPKTGDEGNGSGDGKDLSDKLAYKSYEQYIQKAYKGIQMQGKGEKVKFGKTEATLYRFLAVTGSKMKIQCWAASFVHPEDKAHIVLEYSIPDFKFEDWKDPFKRSAESFKFTKRTADNPDRFKGLSPREADRLRHREDCERTGWKFAETEHFFIKYNLDKADFIKDLKERIEAIRKEYVKYYGDKESTEIPVLRVTKDMKEYYQYGGPGGSGGYWNSGSKELVVPCAKELDIKFTWAVLNHEGFHQFIYYRCGQVDPHSWYNEGTGDYYAGMRYQGTGKFELKTLSTWMAFLDRLSTIKEAIKKGENVPFEKIFRFSQRDYYSNPDVCYAEGWSIIYFLREAKKLGHTPWKPEWGSILPEYERVLFETKDPAKAIEVALKDLKGDKLLEMENSWKDFVKKLD